MKEALIFVRAGLVLAMLCIGSHAYAFNSGRFTPEEIIHRAVEQAKNGVPDESYAFTKTTVHEERNQEGELKERKKQSSEVVFRNGTFIKRPLEGEDATEEAVALANEDNGKKGKKEYLDLLTPELVQKYVFSLVNRTNANGRAVYQIAFRPKAQKMPAHDLKERILNNAAGMLYIDEAEFELVRADVSMDSEISIGGFLGALKRAAFSVERVRLASGAWFERFYRTEYEARKLAQVKRVVTQSECVNFRRIDG